MGLKWGLVRGEALADGGGELGRGGGEVGVVGLRLSDEGGGQHERVAEVT